MSIKTWLIDWLIAGVYQIIVYFISEIALWSGYGDIQPGDVILAGFC